MTFFDGPLHMDVPVLVDQQELIYISSVRTQDVIWKTYRERWIIGIEREREREKERECERERESGKSALFGRLDDDNDFSDMYDLLNIIKIFTNIDFFRH